MNIFVLSKNTKRCAKYHANKHVVKMILEITQMLCAAHIVLDGVTVIEDVELYKLTHKNHACTVWTRTSSSNYKWLYDLFYELSEEYTFRYNKVHLCFKKFENILVFIPKNIPKGPLTTFAIAMPDECKIDENNPVKCYRNYYKTSKKHLCIWTRREIPKWFDD